jgi:hypothetical protein
MLSRSVSTIRARFLVGIMMLSFIAMMFNPMEPELLASVDKPTIASAEMTKPVKFVREQSKL